MCRPTWKERKLQKHWQKSCKPRGSNSGQMERMQEAPCILHAPAKTL